ncbi:hypothetical protein SH668x_002076 [Planctomicrobium sp. SH668]|uniref:hypothetical protein n=1 Tax=Planctomicrobium sp. SH668 TaxID=3448126 RepID=UPI003F5C2F35
MLRKQFIFATLTYIATAIDVGLPTWVDLQVTPYFIHLLFLVFCLTLRGAELVAWSGVIGLAESYITASTPAWGIMIFATIGLFVAWQQAYERAASTILDRLLQGAVLLIGIGTMRIVQLAITTTISDWKSLASSIACQLAATFLLFVIGTCFWLLFTSISHRSFRLGKSRL